MIVHGRVVALIVQLINAGLNRNLKDTWVAVSKTNLHPRKIAWYFILGKLIPPRNKLAMSPRIIFRKICTPIYSSKLAS